MSIPISSKKEPIWRDHKQLMGIQSNLQSAINKCRNEVYVTIDLKTAQNLIDVLWQARAMEEKRFERKP